jgi:propionate CoA-transferase
MYVTERAVFRLGGHGILLIEVAPGIDPRRDVLERIGFPVEVADPLAPMDARLFRDEPMNLSAEFRARTPAARGLRRASREDR